MMAFRSFSFFVALFLCFCLFRPLCAADLDENQKQLRQVSERIEKAEKSLKDTAQTELDLSRELALLKKNLQRIDVRLKALKNEQSQIRRKIQEQRQAINLSQKTVDKSRSSLEKRLVVLYKEGDIGPLKILFSAESPTEMAQQYHYLTRVLARDNELLDDYRVALKDQREKLSYLKQLEDEQQRLVRNEQQQYNTAAQARKLQARLLSKATKDKGRIKNKLATLRSQEKSLKELVKKLSSRQVQTSSKPVYSAPDDGPVADDFAVGRGKLRWPVQGQVIISFGTKKDAKLGTYYESNGIEIATSQGQAVKSVAGGRVVFADYFKGYGNLVIVSHPGGYHTLYAHTDKMQKRTGQVVSAGDVLGYSGLSGRQSIYFEIRKKGSPVNPLSWLKRH